MTAATNTPEINEVFAGRAMTSVDEIMAALAEARREGAEQMRADAAKLTRKLPLYYGSGDDGADESLAQAIEDLPLPTGERQAVRLSASGPHKMGCDYKMHVEIGTGRAVNAYGSEYVTPATEADIAEVLREIEEHKRADEERKAKQEAEAAEKRRRDKLTGDIREVLYRYVPEDVLARALAVLRGEV